MNVIIRFTPEAELQAIPILLRHSPGRILPERTYIVEASAAAALREAGISYREVTPTISLPPTVEDTIIGERI
jgi:hypothetical protein